MLRARERSRARLAGMRAAATLAPHFKRALPPALVQGLPRVVTQGVLAQPAWKPYDDVAAVRAYLDAQQTPRDGYVLGTLLAATAGEDMVASGTAIPAVGGTPATTLVPDEDALAKGAPAAEAAAAAPAAEGTEGASSPAPAPPLRPVSMRQRVYFEALSDVYGEQLPVNYIEEEHIDAFLEGAKTVFKSLFDGGRVPYLGDPKTMTRKGGIPLHSTPPPAASGEDAELAELLHPDILSRWQASHKRATKLLERAHAAATEPTTAAASEGSASPSPTSTPLPLAAQAAAWRWEVADTKIVDMSAVWDGTTAPEDWREGRIHVREGGHTIAVESATPHRPPVGVVVGAAGKAVGESSGSRSISTWLRDRLVGLIHFYGLLPLRRVHGQVTVAFLCRRVKEKEEAEGGEGGSGAVDGAPAATATAQALPAINLARACAYGTGSDGGELGGGLPREPSEGAAPTSATYAAVRGPDENGPAGTDLTSSGVPTRDLLFHRQLRGHAAVADSGVALRLHAFGETAAAAETEASLAPGALGSEWAVHCLTFEAHAGWPEAETGTTGLSRLFRSSTPIETTMGWRVVDVDGHFADAALSFSDLLPAARQKAVATARRGMEEAADDLTPALGRLFAGVARQCSVLGRDFHALEADLQAAGGHAVSAILQHRVSKGNPLASLTQSKKEAAAGKGEQAAATEEVAPAATSADEPVIADVLGSYRDLLGCLHESAAGIAACDRSMPWGRRVAVARAIEELAAAEEQARAGAAPSAAAADTAAAGAGLSWFTPPPLPYPVGSPSGVPPFTFGASVVGGRAFVTPGPDPALVDASVRLLSRHLGSMSFTVAGYLNARHRMWQSSGELTGRRMDVEMLYGLVFPAGKESLSLVVGLLTKRIGAMSRSLFADMLKSTGGSGGVGVAEAAALGAQAGEAVAARSGRPNGRRRGARGASESGGSPPEATVTSAVLGEGAEQAQQSDAATETAADGEAVTEAAAAESSSASTPSSPSPSPSSTDDSDLKARATSVVPHVTKLAILTSLLRDMMLELDGIGKALPSMLGAVVIDAAQAAAEGEDDSDEEEEEEEAEEEEDDDKKKKEKEGSEGSKSEARRKHRYERGSRGSSNSQRFADMLKSGNVRLSGPLQVSQDAAAVRRARKAEVARSLELLAKQDWEAFTAATASHTESSEASASEGTNAGEGPASPASDARRRQPPALTMAELAMDALHDSLRLTRVVVKVAAEMGVFSPDFDELPPFTPEDLAKAMAASKAFLGAAGGKVPASAAAAAVGSKRK